LEGRIGSFHKTFHKCVKISIADLAAVPLCISPNDGQFGVLDRVFRPVGRQAGIFEIGDRRDLIDEFFNLFAGNVGRSRALRRKSRAAEANGLLFRVMIAVERLLPVVAVGLARAFSGVAALERFAE